MTNIVLHNQQNKEHDVVLKNNSFTKFCVFLSGIKLRYCGSITRNPRVQEENLVSYCIGMPFTTDILARIGLHTFESGDYVLKNFLLFTENNSNDCTETVL